MAACIAWHFNEIQLRDAVPHRPLLHAHGSRRAKSSTTRSASSPLIQPRHVRRWRRVPRRPHHRARNLQDHSHRAPAALHSHAAVVLLLFHLHRPPVTPFLEPSRLDRCNFSAAFRRTRSRFMRQYRRACHRNSLSHRSHIFSAALLDWFRAPSPRSSLARAAAIPTASGSRR